MKLPELGVAEAQTGGAAGGPKRPVVCLKATERSAGAETQPGPSGVILTRIEHNIPS